ncbi:MAG TPA: hypothetical protein VLD58_04525 [Gemmatimonadales bacterium]|nr:hypothetical protein [Gemmatimonadales bacterium]
MRFRSIVAAFTLAVPAGLAAQHGGAPAQRLNTVAPAEAKQFDFLVGQWDLTVKLPPPSLAVRIHGGAPKLVGSWKASRSLDGWGIEDELRITDEAGNPMALSRSVRVYDAAAKHWNLVAVDAYRARITTASADWTNGEMLTTSRGVDPDGKAYMLRTKFYEITAAGFKFQQDRSTDDGKTWTEGTLRLEAKRVKPAP